MSKRESILARMAEILAGLFPFNRSARNLNEFPAQARPFAILLDGDEEFPSELQGGKTMANGAKQPMVMSPTINLSIGGTPADVGTAANELVALVQVAVMTDSELQTTIGQGRIVYMGTQFNISNSLGMDVDAQLLFAVHYILNPYSP